jgi:hypothetical protein
MDSCAVGIFHRGGCFDPTESVWLASHMNILASNKRKQATECGGT